MRWPLVELEPEWTWDDRSGGRLGFTFRVPQSRTEGRVTAFFADPTDPDTSAVTDNGICRPLGHRGETFEDMTLFGTLWYGDASYRVVRGLVWTGPPRVSPSGLG